LGDGCCGTLAAGEVIVVIEGYLLGSSLRGVCTESASVAEGLDTDRIPPVRVIVQRNEKLPNLVELDLFDLCLGVGAMINSGFDDFFHVCIVPDGGGFVNP
jgi:hypothetical protein